WKGNRTKSEPIRGSWKHTWEDNMPLLQVENVTGGYGEMDILHEVSMEIEAHEIVSIIGPNGAGKSTLMKTVFGLLHPRSGKVMLDGKDISQLEPYNVVKQRMCYVPQVANVFTTLTVEENLE